MPDTQEAKGLDAHLDAALANYDENLNPIPAEPAPEPEAKAPPAPFDEASELPDKGPRLDESGRAHAPDGKFVAKPPAKAKPSAPEPVKAKAPPATETPEPSQEKPIEPHSRWSDELKSQFTTWPRDVQKAFRDRHDATEADYTRKTQELSEIRRSIEPTLAEVQRQQPFLQSIGYTPDRFIQESVAVAQNLMSGSPQHQGQSIAYLMNLYRVPPEAVLQALGVPLNPGESVQVNPALQQLQNSQLELRQLVQQLQNEQKSWQYQNALAQFTEIGSQTDQNGQRRFPHWDRVKQTMINLVANNQSDSWENAYEAAMFMDPELRKAEIERKIADAVSVETKRRQEAVEKARKASPVVTTPSSPGGGQELKGLDAHLAAAMRQHGYE